VPNADPSTDRDSPSAGLPPDLDPIALLGVYGPDAPQTEPAPSADALSYCHRLARARAENFSVLTSLVPRDLRDDFAAVYAFCRWADDLADETHRIGSLAQQVPEVDARSTSLELLAWWRRGLDDCFRGEATHPVYTALSSTIKRRDLRPEPFHNLIDAFETDQTRTRYESWDDLIGYCRRSADPVGRIVLTLAGHRPPDEDPTTTEIYRQSDMVCTALQLTNFWQDVRTDLLDRDRVYLPTDETGLDADTLRDFAGRPNDPEARVPFILALRPLVERADRMFRDASDLPSLLHPSIAPVVWLFAAGGRRVLRKVSAAGCTSLWTRPKLTKPEKVALVGLAWVRSRIAERPAR
jgi:squalene synthase HpnC